jgi:hypothetical protein
MDVVLPLGFLWDGIVSDSTFVVLVSQIADQSIWHIDRQRAMHTHTQSD